ncbi:hypothetical protein [Microvirga sp. VF16]|uniref:hypothetical protein n=1 Tax=Microvirga sp. VF16 TaxID=2807101 RepID=UPI00193E4EB0|nr:hypothetical protein [Microvirga sp. VF16]QRM33901.1 hypothetical protein JO965_38810 [Microvirga sp. VF16]
MMKIPVAAAAALMPASAMAMQAMPGSAPGVTRTDHSWSNIDARLNGLAAGDAEVVPLQMIEK